MPKLKPNMIKRKADRTGKPKEPNTVPPTREGIFSQMEPLLTKVDAFMAQEKRLPATDTYHSDTRWGPFYAGMTGASKGLPKLWLDLKALQFQLIELEKKGNALLWDRFGTGPGHALSWARPGSQLLWLGDIPVRAQWGGIMFPDQTGLSALDPRRMFTTADGFDSISVNTILQSIRTPEQLFREVLARRMKRDGRDTHQPLRLLSSAGVKAVVAFRAHVGNAWWLEAAKQAPVDPVAVPVNIPAVQTSLFATIC